MIKALEASRGSTGSSSIIKPASGAPSVESFDGPFFPPGRPLPPQAPASVRGRSFNFPYGINLGTTPRQEAGQFNIAFPALRRLVEPARGGLDIMRILIERRKDQMRQQGFRLVGIEKGSDGGPQARLIEEWLLRPDGEHTWEQWVGLVLEDFLVVDAVTIFPRWEGERVVWESIDGATIDLKIDDRGRTPLAPLTAYQQNLQGLPAVDYTVDELIYFPWNIRPGRMYGMGKVETILQTFVMAINRQLSVTSYFTKGSLPDVVFTTPEGWSATQIEEYGELFNSVLSGRLDKLREAIFVPSGTEPHALKEMILKNEFDEWIAKLCCYNMGEPNDPFVKQVNRAVAETNKETAAEAGIEPTKRFMAALIQEMCRRLGVQLRVIWTDEEIQDPQVKATYAINLRGGAAGKSLPVITLDEQRDMLSLPPLTPEQREELEPPEPVDETEGDDAEDGDEPSASAPGESKLAKSSAKKSAKPAAKTKAAK